MGKYFGTDGFRGEAGIDLNADHAYKVGRFLGWYYNMLRERNGNNEPARIVIGKDTRRSSYMFEYSLVAGLTASGADAYLLHVTTTPARNMSLRSWRSSRARVTPSEAERCGGCCPRTKMRAADALHSAILHLFVDKPAFFAYDRSNTENCVKLAVKRRVRTVCA